MTFDGITVSHLTLRLLGAPEAHVAGLPLALSNQKARALLTLITGQGYWHLRTRIQLWLAETLLRRGRIAEAGPHLDEALATARTHNRALLLIQGERLRACLLAERGDWPAANALFAETAERADALGFPLEVARTQAAWGEATFHHSPTPDRAQALLAEARATFLAHDARGELETLGVGIATTK